ncbi:prephenate dehydrogenase [Denitratisoma oestradiolicum]|uniref:prephenate dehydrogenase n=1 Tax=Denitratisoma oestradiolicum TaxID=311182 RepID=A0A6S6YQB6_9PROT|nr:prephenate dehydrogenase/arogenate dehydrogenase family protein [Denitratisoma oestradiolicum]TWO80187.1 prephenate dehydrogenase [Denitratisoma oestradiolicum]CAB1369962.1 Prephenate dehydrogenase [Denitratisoma oestradiolicum]
MARFEKVVICGVGLIGGSFALALKAAGLVGEVVGLGRRSETLEDALHLGIIDRIGADWSDALNDADMVFLGMPVGQMEAVLLSMVPYLSDHTLITDGGSTKTDVVASARAALGARIGQFVPGHPIAGAERSGPSAAQPELFQGRRVVLTPLAENSPACVDRVRVAWEACGAQVCNLTPERHDRTFAAVSHLPHLLAYALVHEIADRENADQLFSFAASGFRDFTRIASSHPEMWRDICLANRPALLAELDAYLTQLLRIRVLLASSDGPGLEILFDTARKARDAWFGGQGVTSEE